jgi:hypothetical protein
MTDPAPPTSLDDDPQVVASRRVGAAARDLIGAIVSSTGPRRGYSNSSMSVLIVLPDRRLS